MKGKENTVWGQKGKAGIGLPQRKVDEQETTKDPNLSSSDRLLPENLSSSGSEDVIGSDEKEEALITDISGHVTSQGTIMKEEIEADNTRRRRRGKNDKDKDDGG